MKKTLKIFSSALLALALVISTAVSALAYEIYIEMDNFDFDVLATKDGSFAAKVWEAPDDNVVERGSATYNVTFNSSTAGTFYGWARIWHENAATNSFFYMNRGEEQILDGYEPWADSKFEEMGYDEFDISSRWYEQWYWQPIGPRDANGVPYNIVDTFDFTAGENTFVIKNREPNFAVDMIIFTTDSDFDPRTIDGNPMQIAAEAAAEAAAAELEAAEAAAAVEENLGTGGGEAEAAPPVSPVSPPTADPITLIALGSLISAAGAVIIAKKRK
jgi:hypothetical protein